MSAKPGSQTGGGLGPPGADGIDVDQTFEVLSNRRRRFMLHCLKQREGERADLSEISTQIAAWEGDASPEEIAYEDRKSVYTSLYQFHAPKMSEAGVIEYERRSGEIRLTDAGRELDVYLETVSGDEIPWSTYYLLLSGAGTLLVGGAWAGLPPLDRLSLGGVATLVCLAFLVSSGYFTYTSRYEMRLGTDGPPPECHEGCN